MKPSKSPAYWQHLYEQLFAPSEARFRIAVLQFHHDLRGHQLLRLRMAPATAAPQEIAFDLAEWRARAWAALRPTYWTVIRVAEAFTIGELQQARRKSFVARAADRPFEVPGHFNATVNRVVGVSRKRFLARLQAAVERGASREDQLADVAEMFDRWGRGRMPAIADDQADASVSVGRRRAHRAARVQLFSWLTAGDHRVRAAHVVFGESKPRPNGFNWANLWTRGVRLEFPHDPRCKDHSLTSGCRCVLIEAEDGAGDPDAI